MHHEPDRPDTSAPPSRPSGTRPPVQETPPQAGPLPEPHAAPADDRTPPRFPAMPASPAEWRYRPPRTPSWWHRHSRLIRVLTVTVLLALCGVAILLLVRERTGTAGLAVGLALAVLPVPMLFAGFRWLDGVEPSPLSHHLFAFGWGACAATLIALFANTFATAWLSGSLTGAPDADVLGATVVAPVVEECAKAVPVVLLFLFRRRHFTGVVSGITIAGMTAAGFAFTENVLYLGRAYGMDTTGDLPYEAGPSATAATFVVRILLSPLAHPLFTGLTGVGFGIAAALPHRRRRLRPVLPVAGLLTAVLLHAIWNGAASHASSLFLVVYALFMMPVLGTLAWLAIWSRLGELRTVRTTLRSYVAAGWLTPPEAWALGTPRACALARTLARQGRGPEAARAVAEYVHFARSLALLRARAERGTTVSDFRAREHELLHHLWQRRPSAAPPTQRAAVALARRPVPPPVPPQRPGGPPGHAPRYTPPRRYGRGPGGSPEPYGPRTGGSPGPYGGGRPPFGQL
ncbi:PrsW family glutamic-type intramembrane protease [Streptomyces sp. TR02-1]|uniref:PrsW family intramembrane metalloprotease n=1 Tax=Streptomyces sp. TR02-1 TaxID=3385977 RepID=UPI0039A1168A